MMHGKIRWGLPDDPLFSIGHTDLTLFRLLGLLLIIVAVIANRQNHQALDHQAESRP